VTTSNGSIRLDSAEFSVLTEAQYSGEPANPLGFDLSKLIPYPYNLFCGIGFICFMALLPLAVLSSLQKKLKVTLNVPGSVMEIISIITGFSGFILTILWGLLDWVWFFAMLFTLILILAVMYYSGHRSGGGGGGTATQ
jgi:hypothetical protein